MTTNEYMSKFPEDVQERLKTVRSIVKSVEPDAKDSFAYGVPAFKIDDKNVFVYAAFKHHLGIYPGPMIIESFKKDLEDYETSKGAIKFPFKEPLPVPLITKIAKACMDKEFTAIE